MAGYRICFIARFLAFTLILSLCWSANASAQATTATILGLVKDPSGAVLPGATVTARNLGTGASRTVNADAQGRYQVADLPIGNYELRASLSGFKTFVQSGITLVVAQQATINITMQVGNVTEQVTVTAEAPLVETSSSQMAGLVSSTQVRELPLNGRSYDQLALLQPGVQAFRQVTVTPNTSFSTRMSVSGARIDSNNIVMDGIEINDWARSGGGSAAGLFLGVDAVQEFKVLTHNYSAEYGRNSGAVINVITRAGTNSVHGSIFEFLRNDNLDARNFFDQEKSTLTRNQFGAFVGGPMVRDKAFFAANYEGFRERRGSPQTDFVLTDVARRGILPTGPITVAPEVVPFLAPNVMPLPNAGELPGEVTGLFVFQFKKPTTENFGMGRLDFGPTEQDSLFFRYTVSRSDSRTPDLRAPTPFFAAENPFFQQSAVLGYTRILSPSAVNLLHAGFKRSNPKSFSFQEPTFPKQLTFVPGQPFGKIDFTTSVNTFGAGAASDLTAIGQVQLTPGHWLQTGYQLNDDLTYTRGAHTFKIGGNYELIRDWIDNGVAFGGNYRFDSIQGFLSAKPVLFSAPLPTLDQSLDNFQHLFGTYVIDNVRATSRVTLNLGMRYEFISSPRDRRRGHTASILDVLRDTDASLTPVFFLIPKANFEPRVGLAWDMTGDGKTSLHAGFGIYHNELIGRDFGIRIQQAPQFRGTITIQPSPVFPDEFLRQQALGFPVFSSRAAGNNPRFFDQNTPTLLHYSVEIERQVFSTTSVRLGYVGSRGYHQLGSFAGNTRPPRRLPDGRFFFDSRDPLLNPNLNPIVIVSSDGQSWYSSMQAGFRMRPTHGLELQASYVWSRNLDNISANAGADARGTPTQFMNPFDFRADKSLSALDQRHNFVLNYLYQIPSAPAGKALGYLANGWSLGGIVTLATGNPLNAGLGFCRSNVTVNCGADRPNLLPGKSNNPVLGGPNRYFDPNAFSLPEPGNFGNVGRNTIIGPGLATFDFSIFKLFPIREDMNLQFRAEFFNLFNRPNFGIPGGNVFTQSGRIQSNAGVIVQTTTTSREIQFGLKFNF